MAISAAGLLAVWTDVEPDAEADFNDWYDREHLPERAAHTGFRGARRYVAEEGTPRYFAAYDTDALAVLGSAEYLRALGNQTPWSKRVLPRMRNMARMVAAVSGDHGVGARRGLGNVVLTLRLASDTDGAAALARALDATALPTVAGQPHVLRASVALGVLAALGGDPALPAQQAADAPDAVAVLVEATHIDTLRRALAGPLSEQAVRAAGATGIEQQGIYRFVCAMPHPS